MSAPKGIELEVEVMDFDERYSHLPNALLRGEHDPVLELDFRGYTLRERCLLGALYGMKSKYRCSRDRIDRLAPELARDAIDTVLRGLKKKGNLVTTRMNDPENSGKFIWRWQVYLQPRKPAGQSMPGLPGDGEETEKSDNTIPGSSIHGSSTRGPSGCHREEVLGTSRTTTLSLSSAGAETSDVGAEDPEREDPAEDPNPKTGTARDVEVLVDHALAEFPHWSRSDTRRAIKAELNDGRPFDIVQASWQLFLEDPETFTPNRFKQPRQWWKTAYGLVAPPKPARQPCSKGHPGGVEGSCGVCLSDAKAADPPVTVVIQAPKQRRPRQPWCGHCERLSRMVDIHGDNPRPCPTCSSRVNVGAS